MFTNVTAGGKSVPNPNPAFAYKYTTDKGVYNSNTSLSFGYDVTSACVAAANKLRHATNSSWPNYSAKASTSTPSKIGCGVEYEAKLSNTVHASANLGWRSQGGGGAVLVPSTDPHAIWYKAVDTVEATEKWIAELYNEKGADGKVGTGGHATALRTTYPRKIQCGMWRTGNHLSMVVDDWNE